jgi:xylan 1,4-beta-xylosidase
MKKTFVSCFVLCCLGSVAFAADPNPTIAVDFSKSVGKLRAVNGVNNGPVVIGNHMADMPSRHREAGFAGSRLHDCHWPNPNVVDIPAIFPLFHADADDPKNYIFAPTDAYLKPIVDNKEEIVYRLGVSIEHKTNYHMDPPADFDKWAKICVNIIRHYNDGWDKGFHWNIRYFEVWNEPDGLWHGPIERYFDLYRVTSAAIKAYNPALKVGGPAAAWANGKKTIQFFEYCRDQKLPVDFYSWHTYTTSVPGFMNTITAARALADKYGFTKAESFCTEWHPMVAGFDKVGWRKERPASAVQEAFAANRNQEAAAFSASALMQMQDRPIDMAHFYTADDSPWSMFDEFGVPGKVFFAFKAFHQFLQTPNRVAVAGASGGDKLTIAAAVANDKKTAAILASNYRSDEKTAKIALQNLPWQGDTKVEIWRVDEKNEFQRTKEATISAQNPTLELDIPRSTVIFAQLTKK